MTDKYILNANGDPEPCHDLQEWARWYETKEAQRQRVLKQEMVGDVKVSTVFLGLDHSFGGGAPILWETMIFGGPHDGYQERCQLRDQAVEMHARAMAVARGEAQPEPL